MSSTQNTTIDLDAMSLDQLQELGKEQEQKLQALTGRYAQLRAAAARLHASQNAISELSTSTTASGSSNDANNCNSTTTVMVPLTESVYVPGTLKDTSKLLVDIGTGFYVERTNKQTEQFLGRKLALVNANSENIAAAVQQLQSNVQSIQSAMQGKVLEIRAKQQGQQYAAAAMQQQEQQEQ